MKASGPSIGPACRLCRHAVEHDLVLFLDDAVAGLWICLDDAACRGRGGRPKKAVSEWRIALVAWRETCARAVARNVAERN